MSGHDAVFSAFEEWMALKGFDLLNAVEGDGGIELDAYRAGAEWMRDTLIALAEANEQEILRSEGEGREWVGVHNLLMELRNAGGHE